MHKFANHVGKEVWICLEEMKPEFKEDPEEAGIKYKFPEGSYIPEFKYNIKEEYAKDYHDEMEKAWELIGETRDYDLIIECNDKWKNKFDWTPAVIREIVGHNIYFESLHDDITEKWVSHVWRMPSEVFIKENDKYIRIINNSKKY